jgi:peptidyl-dipeptidase Dcp
MRERRRALFVAYTTRGDHGNAHDNTDVVARIAALRAERAALIGYASHAHFVHEEAMAKTPERVLELLAGLWAPAVSRARREAADLQARIDAEGGHFALEPWDWRFYTEKVRRARYDVDDQALRPYFPLDRVRDGAFHVAERLFGLTFEPRPDLPVYHREVQAFEVKDASGDHLGAFYTDFHPRPGKRVGAWSSNFRSAHWRDGRDIRPVVVNVCNFPRPTPDAPALLSLEDVQTLFHEFGHALHALLSRVPYASLGSVPRDFVELPSQIMENWALEPEVLGVYARHHRTGAPIPLDLVEKIKRTERFNQGFATVEYLAAAFLDLDWHLLPPGQRPEPTTFERASLSRIGLPREIVVRYRSTYFNHLFGSGLDYAASYYSYIWSEVLDADAFEAFKARGIFDPATAQAFREHILEPGGLEEAAELYRRFRGRDPEVQPLLVRRGLVREAGDTPA